MVKVVIDGRTLHETKTVVVDTKLVSCRGSSVKQSKSLFTSVIALSVLLDLSSHAV
jgi:hypothetical protein